MARTTVRIGARLDIGRQRDHNEDNLRFRQAANDKEARRWGDLFVLADGMGGHAAGEVASRLAVETIVSSLTSTVTTDIPQSIAEAIAQANLTICQQASENRELHGMGTTCVCCVIRGDLLYTAHVGDSRAYFLRNDVLDQITEDHSWVEEQVKIGLLTAEEAHVHPMRNVITRALGSSAEVRTDQSLRQIRPGDVLLICSDGLTTALPDSEIAATLSTTVEPQAAADKLVDLANDAGGPDNIGVIVVRIETVVPVAGNGDAEESGQRSRKGWIRFLPFA